MKLLLVTFSSGNAQVFTIPKTIQGSGDSVNGYHLILTCESGQAELNWAVRLEELQVQV